MTGGPAPAAASRRGVAWIQAALVGVIALLLLQMLAPAGLTWNRSESLPRGLYSFTKAEGSLQRGQLVCFAYQAPEWAKARHYFPEGALLCKEVLGLPGDRVRVEGGEVTVCPGAGAACRSGGHVRTQDSQGRPVPAVLQPGVVPEGALYLGATRRPNSFDSRYLGLIPRPRVVRVITPVWTEKD